MDGREILENWSNLNGPARCHLSSSACIALKQVEVEQIFADGLGNKY